jgi:NAD(P)H-hydrate repair Nnr-like enzyme with NAD(P)H-hydrate dehydratase domain
VPWEEIESYVEKSDAVLIGPGLMRYGKDHEGEETREITRDLLTKFSDKKWVIDGGSLQVMDPKWIPKDSILTPNQKEYKMLFNNLEISAAAKKLF